MSEEMNKELETEVIAGVTAEEPVETMEDFAAELEASYKTLNKRNIELSEEESGQGAKWAQFAQMMGSFRLTSSASVPEGIRLRRCNISWENVTQSMTMGIPPSTWI